MNSGIDMRLPITYYRQDRSGGLGKCESIAIYSICHEKAKGKPISIPGILD